MDLKIGFCISGGIGDAILLSPVAKKIKEDFGEVAVVVFDKNTIPIFDSLGIDCHLMTDFSNLTSDVLVDITHKYLKEVVASIAIWNCFRTDNDGFCNFFYALEDKYIDFIRDKRKLYYEKLSVDMEENILPVKKSDFNFRIARFLCNEENYYSDWKRLGIEVSHKDIFIKPNNINCFEKIKPYCIIHDSKLCDKNINSSIKAWSPEKWIEIVSYLKCKFNVVHFHNKQQKVFEGTISCFDILPSDSDFFDYLDLLSNSILYVGTDSWPGHAAIFLPEVKFLILKGAVSRRWDHFNKYSCIIRKGKCQCCEYLSLEKCIFGNGQKSCMLGIGIEEVKEKIDFLLK